MDRVSNRDFLQFSAEGILSPLPGDLARDYGPCDYNIRRNLNAQYVHRLPIKVRNHELGSKDDLHCEMDINGSACTPGA